MAEVDFWNQNAFALLQQQFSDNSLHHAILLLGPDGIGRDTFAQELAQWMLCQNKDRYSCNECKSCSLFIADNHPDYHHLGIEVDKTQISVAQVRELINDLHESSHQSGWKVANITNVMALNASSFNALLKTLEEPQPNTLIILQSEQLQSVPPTIRSRSQLVTLSVSDQQAIRNWFETNNGFLSADLDMALKIFPQAPYKAEDFAENGDALKCSEFLYDLTSLFEASSQPLQIAKKWQGEIESCVFWWQLIIRDVLLFKQMEQMDENTVHLQFSDKIEAIQQLSSSLNNQGFLLLLDKINELQRLIKRRSPVNLMASWQSLMIYCSQIASKYSSLG